VGAALVLVQRNIRLLLAALTLVLLPLSWWAPLFTLTQLWLFDDRVSMISVAISLFEAGNLLLMLVIGSASMLLPLLKVLLLLLRNLPNSSIQLSAKTELWLSRLSRWAMLDIWVVALLVVLVKLSAWADAQVEWGLYLHLFLVLFLLIQTSLKTKR